LGRLIGHIRNWPPESKNGKEPTQESQLTIDGKEVPPDPSAKLVLRGEKKSKREGKSFVRGRL